MAKINTDALEKAVANFNSKHLEQQIAIDNDLSPAILRAYEFTNYFRSSLVMFLLLLSAIFWPTSWGVSVKTALLFLAATYVIVALGIDILLLKHITVRQGVTKRAHKYFNHDLDLYVKLNNIGKQPKLKESGSAIAFTEKEILQLLEHGTDLILAVYNIDYGYATKLPKEWQWFTQKSYHLQEDEIDGYFRQTYNIIANGFIVGQITTFKYKEVVDLRIIALAKGNKILEKVSHKFMMAVNFFGYLALIPLLLAYMYLFMPIKIAGWDIELLLMMAMLFKLVNPLYLNNKIINTLIQCDVVLSQVPTEFKVRNLIKLVINYFKKPKYISNNN